MKLACGERWIGFGYEGNFKRSKNFRSTPKKKSINWLRFAKWVVFISWIYTIFFLAKSCLTTTTFIINMCIILCIFLFILYLEYETAVRQNWNSVVLNNLVLKQMSRSFVFTKLTLVTHDVKFCKFWRVNKFKFWVCS